MDRSDDDLFFMDDAATAFFQDTVEAAYHRFLGRTPDAEGFAFWVEEMRNGATVADIRRFFAESDEAASRAPIITDADGDAIIVGDAFEFVLGPRTGEVWVVTEIGEGTVSAAQAPGNLFLVEDLTFDAVDLLDFI